MARDTLYEAPLVYGMFFDSRRNDVDFYLERARDVAGPVLELGVGCGRLALALAREGIEVVGVDRSPEMLRELSRRVEAEPESVRARVSWHLADARGLELDQRFDLVTLPFNGLAHFYDEASIGEVFATVRRHLRRRGRFIFDVLVPDPTLTDCAEGCHSYVPWFRDPRTGRASRCEECARYDDVSKLLRIETCLRSLEGEESEERYTLDLRLFPRAEVQRLIGVQGFASEGSPVELGDVRAWICRRGGC